MMKVTKKYAREMLKTAKEALENGGRPVIYLADGRIEISRGDRFGVAEPVYNHTAEILVDTDGLKEMLNSYEYTMKEAVDVLVYLLNDEEILS